MDLLTDQAFFRSFHILFGIAWIGLLYYFNCVQTEYVKVADPDAKADVMKKLAPNGKFWFFIKFFFIKKINICYVINNFIFRQIFSYMINRKMCSYWAYRKRRVIY